MVAVRSSGILTSLWSAGGALPFVPLASSALVMFATARDTVGAVFGAAQTPAGWTLVHTRYTANDAFGIFTAPASVGSVAACADLGNPVGVRTIVELTGADRLAAAAGSTGGQGWGPPTTAGPAATPPASVGAEVMALALLQGTTGDPVAGCYWADKAGWTKLQCSTHPTGHSWFAVYSRQYLAAPAAVSDTFTDTVGQSTQGAVILVPPLAGGAFLGEPGGGVW